MRRAPLAVLSPAALLLAAPGLDAAMRALGPTGIFVAVAVVVGGAVGWTLAAVYWQRSRHYQEYVRRLDAGRYDAPWSPDRAPSGSPVRRTAALTPGDPHP